MGVSKHTIYAWNQKLGGMTSDDAKRLRQLEEENRRLKHLVAGGWRRIGRSRREARF